MISSLVTVVSATMMLCLSEPMVLCTIVEERLCLSEPMVLCTIVEERLCLSEVAVE
jgi:hypothetical protein